MDNKSLSRKLSYWRETQKVKLIDTRTIVITNPIHLNTKSLNFQNGLGKEVKTNGGKLVPIIIQKVNGGSYELLFGLKQLVVYKVLEEDTIPAIIVDKNRDDLISEVSTIKVTMDIEKIKIYKEFSNSSPSKEKIAQKTEDMKKGLFSHVKINKDGFLCDGYITYLVLLNLGVHELEVIIVD